MNREQRRKAGKKEKVRTYTLTDVQIQQIKDDATREAILELLTIPRQVLHDKFGFGQIRLDRFTHYCMNWLSMVENREVTLDELRSILKEESGIETERFKRW